MSKSCISSRKNLERKDTKARTQVKIVTAKNSREGSFEKIPVGIMGSNKKITKFNSSMENFNPQFKSNELNEPKSAKLSKSNLQPEQEPISAKLFKHCMDEIERKSKRAISVTRSVNSRSQ